MAEASVTRSIALLILAAVGIGAFFLADNLFGGDPVDVPDVVGLTEDDAARRTRRRWT